MATFVLVEWQCCYVLLSTMVVTFLWLWYGISHTIALRDQVWYLNIINWVTYASFNVSVELFRFYRLLFVGLLAQVAPWEHWALKRSVNVNTEENLRCCTVILMQLDCCLMYFYNLINKTQWLPSNCEKFNVFNWLVIAHFFIDLEKSYQ